MRLAIYAEGILKTIISKLGGWRSLKGDKVSIRSYYLQIYDLSSFMTHLTFISLDDSLFWLEHPEYWMKVVKELSLYFSGFRGTIFSY